MGKLLILKSTRYGGNVNGNNNSGNSGSAGDASDAGGTTGDTGSSAEGDGNDTSSGEEQKPTEYYATYYFKYNGSDGRWYKNKATALAQGNINTVSFFVALGESASLTATLEPYGEGYARILSVNDVYEQDQLKYSDISWGDTTSTSGEESVSMTISSPRKSLWLIIQASVEGETQGGFTEAQVQYIEDHIAEHFTIVRT